MFLCLQENEKRESKVARQIYTSFFNGETLYVGSGRKLQAQASQIFHYFLKVVTMRVLCYNGEREETMEIREKE